MSTNLPCKKCGHQGHFEPIGYFLFYKCCSCGRSITAKHYRAELKENQPSARQIMESAARDMGIIN